MYTPTRISAETGVCHEQQLVDGLRAYQREFSRYVEEKSGDGGGDFRGGGEDEDYSIEDMPVFSSRSEDLADRLAERSTDILLLVMYSVLFIMLAFVSFLRMDIT